MYVYRSYTRYLSSYEPESLFGFLCDVTDSRVLLGWFNGWWASLDDFGAQINSALGTLVHIVGHILRYTRLVKLLLHLSAYIANHLAALVEHICTCVPERANQWIGEPSATILLVLLLLLLLLILEVILEWGVVVHYLARRSELLLDHFPTLIIRWLLINEWHSFCHAS